MNGIQVLLISGVVVIFTYYVSRFRNALIDLAALVIFAGLGIFFILFPDYTNDRQPCRHHSKIYTHR